MESLGNIFQIKDNFNIQGRGIVAVGVLIKGQIKIGMKAVVSEKTITVKGIEAFNKTYDSIEQQGMEAGILLSGFPDVGGFFSRQKTKIEPGNYSFE